MTSSIALRCVASFGFTLALPALAGTGSAQVPVLFPNPQRAVSPSPRTIASADFDRDGRLDLAVASSGGEQLDVFTTAGEPLFSPGSGVDVGSAPWGVAAGDMNGDGHADLVSANAGSSNVTVLLGNGAGGFPTVASYPTGFMPTSVALGDLDGDGDLDATVANNGDHNITTLLGGGSGGFWSSSTTATNAQPVFLAQADLNEDGARDVAVVASAESTLQIFYGLGTGALAPPLTFGVVSGPVEFSLGDIDENGWLDFIIAGTGGSGTSMLFGTGPTSYAAISGPTNYRATVELVDLDGDGHLDLADAPGDGFCCGSNLVRTALGNGTGTFPYLPLPTLAGLGPADLVAGDWNQDGRVDLASANLGSASISLLIGDGTGQFEATPTFVAGPGGSAGSFIRGRALDADADGNLDVALNLGTGQVAIAAGDGAGSFVTPTDLHVSGGQNLAVGDLNADGDPDLVTGGYTWLRVHLGASGTSLVPPASYAAFVNERALALGDLDQDGALDLAWASANEAAPGIVVRLGDGSGGFGAPATQGTIGTYRGLAIADMDSDGRPDVVAGNYLTPSVTLFQGNGLGGLAAGSVAPLPLVPMSLDVADFDRDGALDALAACGASSVAGLGVLLGDGLGGLVMGPTQAIGNWPQDLAIGDFDADGWIDVATPATSFARLSVCMGDGSGGLRADTPYGANKEVSSVVAADLDGDGREDLVALHESAVGPGWLLMNRAPYAAGIVPYGSGTGGCGGVHGLNATEAPSVGASGFELFSTGAPAGGIGIRLLAAAPLASPADPFGLGFLLNVDPFGGGLSLAFQFHADAHGLGYAPLPIPSDPGLSGLTAYAQALWLWTGACQPSVLGLSSSPGLAITVQ